MLRTPKRTLTTATILITAAFTPGPGARAAPPLAPPLPFACEGAFSFAPELVAGPGGGAITWWLACDGELVARWSTVAIARSEPPTHPPVRGRTTHYGASYHGQPMGCGGTYNTNNTAILAVSPDRYADWPCGTKMKISGPAGSVFVERTDACPGCSGNQIDLSEAGFIAVCGSLAAGACSVDIALLR